MSNYDYDENGNSLGDNRQNKTFALGVSPLVNKISKIAEKDESSCSYGGIVFKILFFMAFIVGGFVVDLIIHRYGGEVFVIDSVKNMTTTKLEMYIGIAALICFFLGTILASFIRPIIPVAGTIAFFSIGYIIGMLGSVFPDYWDIILIALAVTFGLVLSMAIVFMTGIVKVNKKFYLVLFSVLGAYFLAGIIIMILYFVPATRASVSYMLNSRWWILLVGAIVVLLGCMFLLSDFQTIRMSVEEHLPKKYEWLCAFSLTYTIVWIYLRVLDILARLKSRK